MHVVLVRTWAVLQARLCQHLQKIKVGWFGGLGRQPSEQHDSEMPSVFLAHELFPRLSRFVRAFVQIYSLLGLDAGASHTLSMRIMWFSLLLHLSALVQGEDVDGWEAVRAILSAYFPIQDMAFSAGLADGRHFTFEKGQTSMSTPLAMASSSKFPAAIAIAGCVAEGHLTFDTFAHEVFPWWTSDPAVPKSRVTLRNLMSFTSGFYSPDTGGSVPCLGANASVYTAEACAREIYDLAPFLYEPGTTWAYNSFHLQVAGAMAAYAAGISVQELLHRYLIQPLKLNATMWMGGGNPGLAGNMMTTGNDYDRILRAYVGHELIPEKVSKEMERDYLDGVQVANSSTFLVQLLGHYSMCNYFECFPPKTSGFTDQCKRANVHMDAGLFGYYPLVDRAKGMYMQIVTMKFPQSQATYFAPTIASMALRLIAKGWVDKALRLPTQETNKLRTRTIMHEAPGPLLLKLA